MNRGFVFEFKGQSHTPTAESAVAPCGSERDHWTLGDLAHAGAESTRDEQHADTEATSSFAANGTLRGFVFKLGGQSAAPVVVAQPKPRVSEVTPRATAAESSTRRRWPRMRTVCGLLLALGLFGRGLWGVAHQAPVSSPSMRAAPPASVAIEDIRVGQRVVTAGAADGSNATIVDPPTWRRLHIQATTHLDDGTLDVVEVETLQPADAVREIGATVGSIVPIPIDLKELGLLEDLEGVVTINEACPAIQPGPGRVVLTTINHLNSDVLELSLRGSDGKRETVRATRPHRFYSETRSDWVAAADLREGEHLRGIAGPVTVATSHPLPGTHRVYNMSVETEHVYRVSSLGTLVHNTYKSSDTIRKEWEAANKKPWPKDPKTGKNMDVSHELPKADGGTDDLGNIAPRPHEEHMQRHIDNGDFVRWGGRAGGR